MNQLPENFKFLAEIFVILHTYIRLSRCKRTNISLTKLESSNKRTFTLRHLAQLKYILEDAIEIKKVNEPDNRTRCVKPVLHVSINADAAENEGHTKLENVLQSRLATFSRLHPEMDEMPRVSLPVQSNWKELDALFYLVKPTSSSPTSAVALTSPQAESETRIRDDEIAEGTEQGLNSNINNSPNMSFALRLSFQAHREEPHREEPRREEPHREEQLAPASHLSPSFRRHFQ